MMKIIDTEIEKRIKLEELSPGQLFKTKGSSLVFMRVISGTQYAAIELEHGSLKLPIAFEGRILIPIEGALHI